MKKEQFKNPEQLERLYKIREKLLGTDRDDHLLELNSWEKKIKDSLIFLNLQGHEGIQQLLKRADEEIKAINKILLEERKITGGFSTEVLINDSLERQRLLDLRNVWIWFKSLFTEAKDNMNDAEFFLKQQEEPENTDDYVGG